MALKLKFEQILIEKIRFKVRRRNLLRHPLISGQPLPARPGLGLEVTGGPRLAGGEAERAGGEVVVVTSAAAPRELIALSCSRQIVPGDITRHATLVLNIHLVPLCTIWECWQCRARGLATGDTQRPTSPSLSPLLEGRG